MHLVCTRKCVYIIMYKTCKPNDVIDTFSVCWDLLQGSSSSDVRTSECQLSATVCVARQLGSVAPWRQSAVTVEWRRVLMMPTWTDIHTALSSEHACTSTTLLGLQQYAVSASSHVHTPTAQHFTGIREWSTRSQLISDTMQSLMYYVRRYLVGHTEQRGNEGICKATIRL